MSDVRLEDKFPNLQPIRSAPSMNMVGGIGTWLFGRRDEDVETETYVSTLSFRFFFFPLWFLGSYRVASAEGGGYYFLGREPLSALAKAWNAFVVVMALSLCSVGGYYVWYFSPAAIATRKLAEADRLAAAGKLSDAAGICQALVVSNSAKEAQAKERLVGWLASPPANAVAGEHVGVWRAALALSDAGQWPQERSALRERAMQLADASANGAPEAALDLVEAAAPLFDDPKAQVARTRPLLAKLEAKLPGDWRLAVQLAVTFDLEGDAEKCQALLAPHGDKLGSSEGARILGQLAARHGDFESAYKLLSQYCHERLEKFRAAEERWLAEVTRIQETSLQELKDGKAGAAFNGAYNRAAPDRRQEMVDACIASRLKESRLAVVRREEFARSASVVPVALDLGMVQLERAQGMPDPAARKSELERAEKTFLAIRNVASSAPEFQLSLAKVNYWLGKQEEGKKLLDQALANAKGNFGRQMAVAHAMRQVGADSEARTLFEKLYEKATDPVEKGYAALARSLLQIDLDDKIKWLERGPDGPDKRASLGMARGVQFLSKGNYKEAEEQLRLGAKEYLALPEDGGALNDASLCYLYLAQATGNRADLDESARLLDKAVSLQPDNSINILNVGKLNVTRAVAELVEDRLDLQAVLVDEFDVVQFLYHDEAGYHDIADRLKASSALTNARRHLERTLVLAPKRLESYGDLRKLYGLVGDEEALARLKLRIEEAQPDTGELLKVTLARARGEKDKETLTAVADAEKVYRRIWDRWQIEPAGKKRDLTLAIAGSNIVQLDLARPDFGGKADLDRTVKLAEQCVELAPSVGTDARLLGALLTRAHEQLAATHAGYRKHAASCRRKAPPVMAIVLALDDPKLRELVVKHTDFKRGLELSLTVLERYPKLAGAWEWALHRYTQPQQAELFQQSSRESDSELVAAQISVQLRPGDFATAWALTNVLRCRQQDAAASELWKKFTEMGMPLPVGTIAP